MKKSAPVIKAGTLQKILETIKKMEGRISEEVSPENGLKVFSSLKEIYQKGKVDGIPSNFVFQGDTYNDLGGARWRGTRRRDEIVFIRNCIIHIPHDFLIDESDHLTFYTETIDVKDFSFVMKELIKFAFYFYTDTDDDAFYTDIDGENEKYTASHIIFELGYAVIPVLHEMLVTKHPDLMEILEYLNQLEGINSTSLGDDFLHILVRER